MERMDHLPRSAWITSLGTRGRRRRCDDTEFVTLGGLVVNPLVQRVFKGLFDRIKPVSFRLFMPVVVHRTVVPCERMALVPSPHSW